MVVATLGVVVLPVGALAVSSQVAAALDGVVVSRQAFKAKAVFALKPGVGTFTTACHNNSFLESGEIIISRSGASQAQWLWVKR